MKPFAVFYHCLFALPGSPSLLPNALSIIQHQMMIAHHSGLLSEASEFIVGVNGDGESDDCIDVCFSGMAKVVRHGLHCRNENLTIAQIEKWLPEHKDWNVLYFHSKGATHPNNSPLRTNWRNCMMRHLVWNWRRCVRDLDHFDSVGCHWLTNQSQDSNQNLWAGNFWWAKASFLATLPSIYKRTRIEVSGIGAFESRFEAEVWIGNGPRLPRVMDYHRAHPMKGSCR